LMFPIIFGEEYKLRSSSLCSFLQLLTISLELRVERKLHVEIKFWGEYLYVGRLFYNEVPSLHRSLSICEDKIPCAESGNLNDPAGDERAILRWVLEKLALRRRRWMEIAEDPLPRQALVFVLCCSCFSLYFQRVSQFFSL
jgi:hypothetical protein